MIARVRCSGHLHRIEYVGALRFLDHPGDAYRLLKVEEDLRLLRNHPPSCRCAEVLRAWRKRDRSKLPSKLVAVLPRPRTSDIVLVESSAKIPGSWKWTSNRRYRKLGVLEVEPGYQPNAIDDRPPQVIRVHRTWDLLYRGFSDRECEYDRAVVEAEELIATLKAKQPERRAA